MKKSAEIGDNSGEVNAGHLRAFVERVERVHADRDVLAGDLKDIYAELKGNGFDVAIVKKVVALRRKHPSKRAEEAELLDLYLQAIGTE